MLADPFFDLGSFLALFMQFLIKLFLNDSHLTFETFVKLICLLHESFNIVIWLVNMLIELIDLLLQIISPLADHRLL